MASLEVRSGFAGRFQSCGSCLCREQRAKAKAQVELKVAGAVSDGKEEFSRYVHSKGRSKGNIGVIPVEDGCLTDGAGAKAEAFNAFLASVTESRE